jgi:hypothetical protein
MDPQHGDGTVPLDLPTVGLCVLNGLRLEPLTISENYSVRRQPMIAHGH